MNIGIDVDGVLTDIQGYNNRHAPGFFLKHFNREVVDEKPYDIRDIFNCTEEEYKMYWKKYLLRYTTLEPARKGAKKFIHQLRRDGHKIIIISKRVFSCRDDFLGRLTRLIMKNWLCRNGLSYDEVIFCDNDIPDSKRTACVEKSIDIMIDDEVVNIEAVATIAKAICYDASYNRDCEGENIMRACDWNEIYTLIKGLRDE